MTVLYSIGPLTLWHVDPCTDGSDNSCGWFHPRLTKLQRSNLEFLAKQDRCEGVHRFFAARAKEPLPETGFILAQMLAIKVWQWIGCPSRKDPDVVIRDVSMTFWSSMAFMPGWHSNSPDESVDSCGFREHRATVVRAMAREILRHNRPWWKHPRWHFWHWKITCRPFWRKTDTFDVVNHENS